jgi:hypothetical protein
MIQNKTARANVMTWTWEAPFFFKTSAQFETVAPDVNTSSTSNTF